MLTLSQMDVAAGRPDKNLKRMLLDLRIAEDRGSDLHVFNEMAVPGYMIGDEWENESFVRECEDMNADIVAATRGSAMNVIWGNVATDADRRNEDGRLRKYNAAYVARDGLLVPNGVSDGRVIKTLMPNYRQFDDKRHFTSLRDVILEEEGTLENAARRYRPFDMTIAGVSRRVGVIICEDMWDDDYLLKPVKMLVANGADMIVNISASPYGIGKEAKRDRLLMRQSEGIDLVYANNTGVQENSKNLYLFDGASPAYRDGRKVYQAPSFASGVFEVTGEGSVEATNENVSELDRIETALVHGVREYMARSGQKKLVIGLSGGVDSALVAALAVRALGAQNVIGVNMPSKHNSDTTKDLARELADELGIEYGVVPIQESVDHTKRQLAEIMGIAAEGLMDENIQARDRGSRVLSAVASLPGHILSNNGNKLEMATGYASIAGDLNGALAVIGDLYKTQVFALSRSMARKYGIRTLDRICDIPPSAELSADQSVDEGKGDPFVFEYHDRLMYQFIEMRRDPQDILAAYRDGKLETLLNSWAYDVGPEYAMKKPIIGPG
jgi:NAD+ synthase (glutamine-hydrolysing)